MVTIQFKPIEALHFGGFGEFSPTARGPAVLGRVSTTPPPTTILGLLTYLACGINHCSGGTLYEDYISLCRVLCPNHDLYIRGPYLVIDNDVHIVIDNVVINVSDGDSENGIYRYIAYAFAKVLGKDEDPKIEKYTDGLFRSRLSIIKFLGVGLKRDLKISDEEKGLLYLNEYVNFTILDSSKKTFHDSNIAIDLVSDTSINLDLLKKFDGKPTRLGGEQRIAQLYVEENRSRLVELCEKYMKDSEYYLLIHVTPTIIEVPKNTLYINYKHLSKNLFGSEDCIIGCIGKFGKDPLGVVCLGFNEIKKARRPLKCAIMPGSITIVRNLDKDDLRKICRKGIECPEKCDNVECNKIGFNTIIPIPTSELRGIAKELVDQVIEILGNH